MTRPEIREQIQRLEVKVDKAIEAGNRRAYWRYEDRLEELQEELDVQPHEFGGEV